MMYMGLVHPLCEEVRCSVDLSTLFVADMGYIVALRDSLQSSNPLVRVPINKVRRNLCTTSATTGEEHKAWQELGTFLR